MSNCNDCGLEYSAMGVDLALPDQVWKFLAPDCGILCANCICLRLKKRGHTTVLLCWPDSFRYDRAAADMGED